MSWSETEMLEIFGRRYEYLSQKEFDAARKSHRVDFGGCLFENVTLDGLRIAGGDYDFSGCRFLDCTISNSYLDGVLFEGTTFEDCLFENVEALRASFTNARVFHSCMCNSVLHDFDAQGSSWRHGFMHNALLGRSDLRAKLIDSFTFQNVRAVQCNPPDTEAITMGGATKSEVSHYRSSVLKELTARNDLALFDELAESRNNIYSAIYYLSPERVAELAEYVGDETNDPETQEWRDSLEGRELRLVQRWDAEFEQGMQKIAEAFRAARSSSPQQTASLPGNTAILAQRDNFILVRFDGSKDFYGFGSRRDGFSFPSNQCGTKAEVMAELARWQAEVDRDNPAMLDVEQAFLETLEREMPQTSPGKLDAICQRATARADELNAKLRPLRQRTARNLSATW